MAIPRANLLLFGTSALALAVVALGTSPVVAQGEPQEVGSPEDGKEAGRAQAKAEKQQQREAEKAQAEAEKQQQREAEKAKAAAETQLQDAGKSKGQQIEDKAKDDAGTAIPPTKAEAKNPKRKQDAEKAESEAEKQQLLDAAKAKVEAEQGKGKGLEQIDEKPAQTGESGTDKGAAEANQKRLEADKAKAEAEANRGEADKAKAGADQQKQLPPSKEDRTGRGAPRDGARAERRVEPKNETQAVEQLKQERAKADDEFEKAKRAAEQKTGPAAAAKDGVQDRERRSEGAENEFVRLRKQRQERVEDGGRRAVIEEPDKRVIVIEKDRSFVRHDETRRFARAGTTPKRERRKDGTILSIYVGFGGVEILNLEDEDGRLLRRSRRGADGREIVLVDNRRFYSSRPRGRYYDAYVDLAPPVVRIPRDKYIVEYDEASEEDIYEALNAPPIERLQRGYALEEVRQSRWLRERMRRVDLNAINFAFASWEVDESQDSKLERVADAMRRILERNPDEMFLIEGHTDAVGSDIDNLSLSDRRAESVAIILSDTFRVPPENLATQGYGEQYLKVPTEGPSRANRRVAVRRITPLLSRSDDYSDRSPERVR